MPKRILLQLNEKSIDEAIKEVQDYTRRFETMVDILCRKLIAEGVQFAKDQVKIYGAVESWNLHDSIEGFYDPVTKTGIIKCYATNNEYNFNYAQVVEFGSGVGQSRGGMGATSHVEGANWKRDIHHYGEKGWWYGDGRWTMGQEPRPFMYETYLKLIEEAKGLASVRYYNVPDYY